MIDRTMLKIRDEDPSMTLQEALDKACYWKNIGINSSGYSAHQLVFGVGNPVIPGIVHGHLSTDEPVSRSETVKKVLTNHINTREAFREADNQKRIKKMLKNRVPSYIDAKYKS